MPLSEDRTSLHEALRAITAKTMSQYDAMISATERASKDFAEWSKRMEENHELQKALRDDKTNTAKLEDQLKKIREDREIEKMTDSEREDKRMEDVDNKHAEQLAVENARWGEEMESQSAGWEHEMDKERRQWLTEREKLLAEQRSLSERVARFNDDRYAWTRKRRELEAESRRLEQEKDRLETELSDAQKRRRISGPQQASEVVDLTNGAPQPGQITLPHARLRGEVELGPGITIALDDDGNHIDVQFVLGPSAQQPGELVKWQVSELPESLETVTEKIVELTGSLGGNLKVRFNDAPASSGQCLLTYIYSRGNSTWTKTDPRVYACRSCVSTQRPCMIKILGVIHVLPLPPSARFARRGSGSLQLAPLNENDVGYWVAPITHLTTTGDTHLSGREW